MKLNKGLLMIHTRGQYDYIQDVVFLQEKFDYEISSLNELKNIRNIMNYTSVGPFKCLMALLIDPINFKHKVIKDYNYKSALKINDDIINIIINKKKEILSGDNRLKHLSNLEKRMYIHGNMSVRSIVLDFLCLGVDIVHLMGSMNKYELFEIGYGKLQGVPESKLLAEENYNRYMFRKQEVRKNRIKLCLKRMNKYKAEIIDPLIK